MRVLTAGHADIGGHRHELFECKGKLTQGGDHAKIEDFRFQVETAHTHHTTNP